MIVTKLMGGLGNQLFQYAAGRALAIQHKIPLKLFFEDNYKHAKRKYALDDFHIEAGLVKKSQIKEYLPDSGIWRLAKKRMGLHYRGKVYREKEQFVFDKYFLNQSKDSLLIGFWQSHKYIEHIQKELRQEVVLKNSLSESAKNWENKILASNSSVAIHVRRGDYTNPKSGFSPLPISYYKKSITYIESIISNAEFFVFTDDPIWVEKYFINTSNQFTLIVGNNTASEDLHLISICRNAIIANSSFSWWGAWLNKNENKKVLYPFKWSNDFGENISDLFPSKWQMITYD